MVLNMAFYMWNVALMLKCVYVVGDTGMGLFIKAMKGVAMTCKKQ